MLNVAICICSKPYAFKLNHGISEKQFDNFRKNMVNAPGIILTSLEFFRFKFGTR